MPPRHVGTRSMRSCKHCALCCPSPRRRRSGSPTSTPWPWCASSFGELTSSLQVPMGTTVPFSWAQLCSAWGAAPVPFQNSFSHCASPAASAPPSGPVLAAELLSLLPGFLLVLSAGGKLVYISENVSQILGLSMVRAGQCGFAITVSLCPLCMAHCPHERLLHSVRGL